MMPLFALQQAPPPDAAPPVIVKIIDPPSDVEGLADVLLGALGIAGAGVLIAVVLALILAGLLLLYRFKFSDPFPSASEQRPGEDTPASHITR